MPKVKVVVKIQNNMHFSGVKNLLFVQLRKPIEVNKIDYPFV